MLSGTVAAAIQHGFSVLSKYRVTLHGISLGSTLLLCSDTRISSIVLSPLALTLGENQSRVLGGQRGRTWDSENGWEGEGGRRAGIHDGGTAIGGVLYFSRSRYDNEYRGYILEWYN